MRATVPTRATPARWRPAEDNMTAVVGCQLSVVGCQLLVGLCALEGLSSRAPGEGSAFRPSQQFLRARGQQQIPGLGLVMTTLLPRTDSLTTNNGQLRAVP